MRRFLKNLAIALLLSPGITWAQTVTPGAAGSGSYTTPSYGLGINESQSFYDSDDFTRADLIQQFSNNMQSPKRSTVELVQTGTSGGQTFKDSNNYNPIPAGYTSGTNTTYSVNSAAHLTATVSGGSLTALTCAYCGYYYPHSSTVTVYIEVPYQTSGTQATAHFATNSSGALVNPGIIDNAGSGYSFTPEAWAPMVLGVRSGSITNNTAASGGGVTWTLGDTTSGNDIVPGDYVTISYQPSPSPSTTAWTTGTNSLGLVNGTSSGTGALSFGNSSIPTGTNAQQYLQCATGSSGTCGVYESNDTGVKRYVKISTAHTYQNCVQYQITAGSSSSIAFSVQRNQQVGSTVLYSGSVAATTSGALTTSCSSFTGVETSSSPVGALADYVTFSGTNVTAKIYRVTLRQTDLESANVPANTYYNDDYLDNLLAAIGGAGQMGGAISMRQWTGAEAICDITSLISDPTKSYPCGHLNGNASGGLPTTFLAALTKYKVLQSRSGKAIQPELPLPATMTLADAALVNQWLFGGCGTTGGAIRCAEGQTAPWTGPGGVFAYIKLTIGDENWNGAFYGQIYGDNSYISPSQTYSLVADGQYSDQIWAAMQADSSYASGYINFSLTTQSGFSTGQAKSQLRACLHCTMFEDEAYIGGTNSQTYNKTTDNAGILAEAFQISTSAGIIGEDVIRYAYFPQNPQCSIYEMNENGSGQVQFGGVTQAQANNFTAGFISALADGANFANLELNAACHGPKTFFTYGQRVTGGSPYSALWGEVNDVENDSNPNRWGYYVEQAINAGVLGQAVSCSTSGIGTSNFTTTGTWVAGVPVNNIPNAYALCYANGSSRSIVVVNTQTSNQTLSCSGAYCPTGSVTQLQVTASSQDDNAESYPLYSCSSSAGTTTCTLSTVGGLSGFPFATGDTTVIANSSGGCDQTTGAITFTSPRTIAFTGTCNSTNGFIRESGTAPNIAITTPGSAPTSFPTGVTTLLYTVGTPQVATPAFSPGAGTYTSTQTIAITTATSGAGLCYTTDGSTPTSSGTACTHGTSVANGGTVSVSSSLTLNAIGYLSGDTVSSVGTAAYTISTQAAAPTLSPGAGSYASAQSVTPSSSTPGATFLSCIGVGCTPSTPVSGTISVTASETIGVLTQASGYSNSTVTYAAYVINGTLPTPTFSPAAGNYSTAQSVAISDAVSGTSIYYTTNGSTPTTGSTLYTGPVAVSTNQTVQAIAVKTGYVNSSVGSAAYTFTMTGVNLNCSGTVTILPSTVLH